MRSVQYFRLAAVVLIGLLHEITQIEGKQKVICYYANWNSPYKRPFQYDVSDIPFKLCDTLVWYHDTISTNGSFQILPGEKGTVYERKFLRNAHEHKIPVYLGIGGYGMNLKEFSSITSMEQRNLFFESIVAKFQLENMYTGLLIDWGYPGLNGDDQATYTLLLEFLHEKFQSRNWTLAISGANDQDIIEKGYDTVGMNRYVDEVHVNCHHFPDFFNKPQITKDHSPLYSEYSSSDSVEKAMNIWSENIPPEKLFVAVYVLGVTRGNHLQIGRPLAHFEVCTYLMLGVYKEEWNSKAKVAHATTDDGFPDAIISYETAKSLLEKARYVQKKGYGGIAFKFVNDDDFRGFCGKKNALLKSIHAAFDEP